MSWPTALWSIGSVGIYINAQDINQESVIGETHVLDATDTTKHHSGSTGQKIRVSGILVTTGCSGPELATLQGYAESATKRTLTTDMGSAGDWYVRNVQAKRKQALNVDYPVYEVSMDLLE